MTGRRAKAATSPTYMLRMQSNHEAHEVYITVKSSVLGSRFMECTCCGERRLLNWKSRGLLLCIIPALTWRNQRSLSG